MNNSKEEYSINNEEIDIVSIFYSLLRNKKLISQITFLSFFIGIFYSLNIKKIWEGNFQIVLTQNKDTLEQNNIGASPLLGSLTKSNDNLTTEVGILQSPLVLNKIFNYVKESKFSEDKQIPDTFTFKVWKRDSLRIDLEKGTSILNLSYRDEDKQIIFPVLNQISKSYQDYSGRRKSRRIEFEKTFYNNQIKSFKEKSINSLRNAQEFAIEQDLSILQGDAEIDKEIPNTINIEAIRIKSANNIREIDIQLKALKDMNDPESLMYLGSSIPELVEQGLPSELDSIDRKIINYKTLKKEINNLNNEPKKIQYYGNSIPQLSETGLPRQLREIETNIEFKKFIYKNEDKIIKDLLKRRNVLIKVFKQQAINYLNADIKKLEDSKPKLINLLKAKTQSYLEARKITEEAILKAAERPKGVLLEYRELLNEANKNKFTLEKLENEYRAVLLEEAKTEDPWELITSPTLLKNPVYPNKKLIVLYSLFLGILGGSLIAILIERKKNLFLNSNSIQKKTKIPKIMDISTKNEDKIEESFNLLMKSAYLKNEKNIAFIKEGQLDKKLNKIFESNINSLNYDFKTIDEFLKSEKFSKVILMPILGKTPMDKITNDIENLRLIGVNIIGTLSINDPKNLNAEIDPIKEMIFLFNAFLISQSKFTQYIKLRFSKDYIKSKLNYYSKYLRKNSNSINNKTK